MNLYIPSLGEQLCLTADWSFDLYNEYRNDTLMEYLGVDHVEGQMPIMPVHTRVALPTGTILKMDRIYIRKGSEDFDSITFLLVGAKTKPKTITRKAVAIGGENGRQEWEYEQKKPARPVRFWVKLKDANSIEFRKVLHEG